MQTEYEFTLPKGYVDSNGTLHTKGIMRLATEEDVKPLFRDSRMGQVRENMIDQVLIKVITQLGDPPAVDTEVIGHLFFADREYLKDFYNTINHCTVMETVIRQNAAHWFD